MSTLIYMNIKGQGHSLTLFQGHSDSTLSNFFSLETARPIEAKFHVKPPWDRGTKVCSNGLDHMTNMAALKNLLLRNQEPMTLKLGMHYRVLEYYRVCS